MLTEEIKELQLQIAEKTEMSICIEKVNWIHRHIKPLRIETEYKYYGVSAPTVPISKTFKSQKALIKHLKQILEEE